MSSGTDHDSDTKLPKRNTSKDHLHWLRRLYAFIRRNEIEQIEFSELAEDASAAVRNKWLEAMIMAKTAIILSLLTSPLARLAELIDNDDDAAKEL